MSNVQLSWVQELSENSLSLCVNLKLYPLEALFRACYAFTDRCYLFLAPDEALSVVKVDFTRKTPYGDLSVIAGEFSNELINQKVRFDVAAETKQIRELIVAQAFTEADLLDRSHVEADYHDDPKGIS